MSKYGARVYTGGLMRHKQNRKPRSRPRQKVTQCDSWRDSPGCRYCGSDEMALMGNIGNVEYWECNNCGHITSRKI